MVTCGFSGVFSKSGVIEWKVVGGRGGLGLLVLAGLVRPPSLVN